MQNTLNISAEALPKHYSIYRQFPNVAYMNIFTEQRHLLARWCADMEKDLLAQPFSTTVFAAFQQLEYFLPVADRYLQLAEKGNTLYVFGEPYPTLPQHENLHYVFLMPQHALRKEWFLIIHHADYARALIAQEISPHGTAHRHRTFKGALTSDVDMVSAAHDNLLHAVNHGN